MAKNRRIRFSLSKLLLFLTFCGILCGWFCHAKIYPAYRRKAVIAHFRALNVEFEYGVPVQGQFDRFRAHHPEKTPRIDGPSWLRGLVAPEWLESPPAGLICVTANRPLGDADFERLRQLPSLEQIDLNCNQVPRVSNNVSLANYREQTLSDDALQSLALLPHLRRLKVVYTKLTDRGIANLAKSPSLESVVIDHSDVSDAALRELAKLSNLRVLSVRGTNVTANGVAEFVAIRPDVELLVDNEYTPLLVNIAPAAHLMPLVQDRDPEEWFVRDSSVINGTRIISLEKRDPNGKSEISNDAGPSPSRGESSPASLPHSTSSRSLDSTDILRRDGNHIEENHTGTKNQEGKAIDIP